MKMAKTSKPEFVQLFENLLWANSPSGWIFKSTYFRGTLFVSILVEGRHQKIRRSFNMDIIHSRSKDLWGLALDCIGEIKSEINK